MTRHEQDRVASLDRQWDRYLSGVNNVAGNEDELKQVARLHALDDTPAASDAFRERLHDELQSMFAEQATGQNAADSSTQPIGDDAPALHPASGRRGPISVPDTGRYRRWGELAAMLLVLIVAIAATALFGDDAYDFAQRQLSPGNGDVGLSELQDRLRQEGEVQGITFDEAQELTPFELPYPESIPGGLSDGDVSVAGRAHYDPVGRVWPRWSAEIVFEPAGEDLEPIQLSMHPTWEGGAVPIPQDVAVEGAEAPRGNLDMVQIGGVFVVRSVEFTEDRGVFTHYRWRQGRVDLRVSAPVGVDMNAEQEAWVDAPVSTFDYGEVEEMIASIIKQGPLEEDADRLEHRGLSLDDTTAWTPTFPFPDSVPDALHLEHVDASPNGPNMFLSHVSNDAIGEIWLHSFVGLGIVRPDGSARHQQLAALGGDVFEHNGVTVTRIVLPEPTAPAVSEYMIATRTAGDHLLPWMTNESDDALVAYLYEVAGGSFIMGVEVPAGYVEVDGDGAPTLTQQVPEQNWLDLIDAQRRTAEANLGPEDLFPALARDESDEDELPGHQGRPDEPSSMDRELDRTRLIGETEDTRYYIGMREDFSRICVIVGVIQDEQEHIGSAGCNSLWRAAETGVGVHSAGRDQPARVAYLLPQGYDEVVDENGDLLAEVENQLFALTWESGDTRPRDMIARGPAGELHLELGTWVSMLERPEGVEIP